MIFYFNCGHLFNHEMWSCKEKILKQRMKEDQRMSKRLHTLGHFTIGQVEKTKLFHINPCHVAPVDKHQNKEKMQK